MVKRGDELIWDKSVELKKSDWRNIGEINHEYYLNILLSRYGKIIVKKVYKDYYTLNDGYCYPKKLFRSNQKTYSIW
jgi:hypothetical protein